jgi:sugar porter (SP) family MFS transporter
MFASAAVPSVAFLVALFFVPESPRWLVEFNREDEAFAVLKRIGGHAEATSSMAEIKQALAEESGTLSELLQPGLRTALIIAIVLAVLQQVTGINTVLFYGAIIFREQVGNHSQSAAIGANVIVGIINFLATIVALWIIDRVGRKALLMISAGAMGVSMTLMGIAFLFQPPPGMIILGLIVLCVASFAVGLGPGVWVVLSEIFPTRVRGRAMSIATVSLWVACVALTSTFLSLVRAITITGAFWLYAVLCLVTFVFVWRVCPETKGLSLEQIERMWKRD